MKKFKFEAVVALKYGIYEPVSWKIYVQDPLSLEWVLLEQKETLPQAKLWASDWAEQQKMKEEADLKFSPIYLEEDELSVEE